METRELKEKLLEEVNKLPIDKAEVLKDRIKAMNEKELHQFIKSIANNNSKESCLFCQIIGGKIETVKIYESKNIMAILDIYPANPGHMIILPKQHYQFISQVPHEVLYELFSFIKYIYPVMLDILRPIGIDIYVAQGISQRVPHLSINLIPRFKDDGVTINWKRNMTSRDKLKEIAYNIRKKASSINEEKRDAIVNNNEKESRDNEEEKELKNMLKFYKERVP